MFAQVARAGLELLRSKRVSALVAVACGALAVLAIARFAPDFLGIGQPPNKVRAVVCGLAIFFVVAPAVVAIRILLPGIPAVISKGAGKIKVLWRLPRLRRDQLRILGYCVEKSTTCVFLESNRDAAVALCRMGLLERECEDFFCIPERICKVIRKQMRHRPDLEELSAECQEQDGAVTQKVEIV